MNKAHLASNMYDYIFGNCLRISAHEGAVELSVIQLLADIFSYF